jgi:hypothetical protein
MPAPFHTYLLPRPRGGAYWGSKYRAQVFSSPQEAEAEAKSALNHDRYDIVPYDHRDVPDYWELSADWQIRAAQRREAAQMKAQKMKDGGGGNGT